MPLSLPVRVVTVLLVTACWAAVGACAAAAQVPGLDGRIAFDSDRDGNQEIYTMAANGTDARRLTADPARDRAPQYAPDGRTIVFVSDRDGNPEIYAMDADGAHQRRLTSDPALDLDPTFSPDGTRIAFSSDRTGSQDIYSMAVDGGDVRLLVGGAATQETSPAYSPDGTRLAFSSNAADGNVDIWVLHRDAKGTPPYSTRLTTDRAPDSQPSYAPDGRHIVFVSNREPASHGAAWPSDIYWMDAADGRHEARVTGTDGDDRDPSFAPDGLSLLYSGAADVRISPFTGPHDLTLGVMGAADGDPSWESVSRPPLCQDAVLNVPTDRVLRASLRCTDPDGEPFAAIVVMPPSHGTATFGPGGALTYVPAPGFEGRDTFTAVVHDRRGASSRLVAVSVAVAPFRLFKVGTSWHGPITARRPVTLSYWLSAPARVRLTLRGPGRAVGPVKAGGVAGWNFFEVRRTLAGRTLRPGRYRLTVTATLPDGEARARTVRVSVAS